MRQIDKRISRHWPTIVVGILLTLGCAYLASLSWSYGLGSARRIGPGLLPFILSVTGAILSAILAISATITHNNANATEQPESFPMRRFLFISASFAFFALTIQPLGLLIALFGTAFIGAFADKTARLRESLLLATGLTLSIGFIFVYLLGLSITLLPEAF